MTLAVIDENGQEINEENPLITEHNGSEGDTITRALTLINKSDHYYYKDIRIEVNPVFPVNPTITAPDVLTPVARPEYLERGEKFPFNLELSVAPGTPDQVVRGINLKICGTRFLSSSRVEK